MLVAAAHKKIMERLLAAIIEAIFVVCGQPNITVRQCLLLLEKWNELIVGPKQIILGLIVDNKMTVGITDKYIQQKQDLLNLWDPNHRLFKVNDMQKLIGKLVQLGEGAQWVFKLMSHRYTCLLLKKGSSGFRELYDQISKKNLLQAIRSPTPH
jgi:hypothetical protein